MDPITHAVLGAVCAEAVLFNKDRKHAWIAGGLAAMAPDLDVLIRSAQNPMLSLIFHRNFTHAFLFIPLGALIVTLFLMVFPVFRKNPYWTFLAALIGYATHAPLDVLTNYGTMIYWPFSNSRITFSIISIVDPYITFPLVLGLAWTLIHESRHGVFISLFLVSGFLLFNTIQHEKSLTALQDYAKKNHWDLKQSDAYPHLASSSHFRGLAIEGKRFWILHIVVPVFKPAHVILSKSYPLAEPEDLPAYVKNSPTLLQDYLDFQWFSNGYLVLVKKDPLLLSDGRFLISMDSAESIWSLLFLPNHQHAEKITSNGNIQ